MADVLGAQDLVDRRRIGRERGPAGAGRGDVLELARLELAADLAVEADADVDVAAEQRGDAGQPALERHAQELRATDLLDLRDHHVPAGVGHHRDPQGARLGLGQLEDLLHRPVLVRPSVATTKLVPSLLR